MDTLLCTDWRGKVGEALRPEHNAITEGSELD